MSGHADVLFDFVLVFCNRASTYIQMSPIGTRSEIWVVLYEIYRGHSRTGTDFCIHLIFLSFVSPVFLVLAVACFKDAIITVASYIN
jgi:hypothetical protein